MAETSRNISPGVPNGVALSSLSRNALRRAAILGGAVFALLAAAAGFAVVTEWRAALYARHWVDHTYQVIDQIRSVFDDVQDAESGARGFFITGDDAYLKAHNVALERLDGDIDALHEAVKDNDVQVRQFEILQPLLMKKLASIKNAVALRREAGKPILRDLNSSQTGRIVMEEIRAVIDAMIQEERRLLVLRSAERDRSTRINLSVVVASFVIAALSIAVVLILTGGYLQRRRETEAALTAQSALLTATFDNISQALCVYDAEHRLVAWNNRFKAWTLLSEDLLKVGTPVMTLMRRSAELYNLGDRAEAWIAERMAQLRSRIPQDFERALPDGTILQVRGTFTQEGLAVTTFSDITDLKRSEQALMSNVSRLNAIFDNTIDGLITINESGSIESFNPASEKIFGHKASELLGRNIKMLMPEPYRGAHDGYLRTYKATGEKKVIGSRRELEGIRADGSIFPIEVSINEFWSNGRRLFVGVVRDITERRQIERMKTDFISTVSHELRTPLTSIAGSLGLLAGAAAGELPDRAKRLVDIANKNSERLVRLVNDILDLDKIESGRMKFNFAPVAVKPLLESCIEANRAYAANLNVRLVLDPGSIDGTVSGDTDRLTQVFTNLLSNAAKFSPSGDKVDIVIGQHASFLRVSVIDHGPGIPDEFRATIFQKFAQADAKDNRRMGGTGLGLSIARSIVEKHGGAMSFDSVPGAGASFHVDLPLWQEGLEAYDAVTDDEAHHEMIAAMSPTPLLRVLHVEDDEDVRRIVRLSLEGVANIAAAHSVEMARRRLNSSEFDLVILDISLPDGNGLDLLPMRHLPSGRSIPVIVFSAQDTNIEIGPDIKAVLIKTRASTAELMRHVRAQAADATKLNTTPEPERTA